MATMLEYPLTIEQLDQRYQEERELQDKQQRQQFEKDTTLAVTDLTENLAEQTEQGIEAVTALADVFEKQEEQNKQEINVMLALADLAEEIEKLKEVVYRG